MSSTETENHLRDDELEQLAEDRLAELCRALDDMEVDYESEDGIVSFFEPGDPSWLWIDVAAGVVHGEVRLHLSIESDHIVKLGSIGSFLPDLSEIAEWSKVTHMTGRESAFVDLFGDYHCGPEMGPEIAIDILTEVVSRTAEILEAAAARGTTFSEDNKSVRSEGFADLASAMSLDSEVDPDGALEPLIAARDAFQGAGLTTWHAICEVCLVDAHTQMNDLDGAQRILERVDALIQQTGENRHDLEAARHSIVARLLLAQGRPGEAQKLLKQLNEDPEVDLTSETFAHVPEAMLLGVQDGPAPGRAADFYRESLDELEIDAPVRLRAVLHYNLAIACYEHGDLNEAIRNLERATNLYVSVGAKRQTAEAKLALAGMLAAQNKDTARANELFDEARVDLPRYSSIQQVETVVGESLGRNLLASGASARSNAFALQNRAGRLTRARNFGAAREAATEAFEFLEQDQRASAHERALLLFNRGFNTIAEQASTGELDPATSQLGLNDAIESIKLIDQQRMAIDDSRVRSPWMERFGALYLLAFGTAADLNQPAVSVEVLELLGTQGVGLGSIHPSIQEAGPVEDSAFPTLISELTRSSVWADHPYISVNGHSSFSDGDTTVALEKLVDAQAGREAWYWNQWLHGPALMWALVSPVGEFFAGLVPLGGNELPTQNGPWTFGDEGHRSAHSFAGYHCGGEKLADRTEKELAVDLGKALVPAQLREALKAASQEDPITIVFSPSEPSPAFPTSLLAVNDAGVRVLERARIQIGVPAMSVMQLRTCGSGAVSRIVDPTDDMPSLQRFAKDDSDRQPGIERFWDCADRCDSLLFIGHGIGPSSAREGAGIRLGRGSTNILTVASLLTRGAEAVPPKVILAGCSTAGLLEVGQYERWSLPSALIGLGASQVVSTRADLDTTETVAAVIAGLDAALESDADLVDALRDVQLDHLRKARLPDGSLTRAGDWISWVAHSVHGWEE